MKDELLWAAAWLFRATGEEYYLKYVVENAVSMGGTGWAVKEFSWDNKYAGLQVLLSKVLMQGGGKEYVSTLKQYKAKADYFACACLQKNDGYNVPMTPGNLMYLHEWNNMQYVSSAAFLLAVYSDYLSTANAVLQCPNAQIEPKEVLAFAKSQADYILGKNPRSMSYLVGYGPRYPVHVHHRGASIASLSIHPSKVGCVEGFETWYRRSDANPNILYGALVGGPDKNDEFYDDRSSYEQTEPTLTACAPLIGLFSKLYSTNVNSGSYTRDSPVPQQTTPSSYTQKSSESVTRWDVPVKFGHSVTDTWTIGKIAYYRHKVIIKNTTEKPIKDLKLLIENLSGTVYGLTPAQEKNTYELPQWQNVLNPGSECTFVYVQGGPQAKISVLSYH